jgi:branched-chain amino acid transport system permease protein
MVYGILRMINFAHGDIFMMAAYFAFFGIVTFRIPWYFSFVLVIVFTAGLGILNRRFAYRPLRDAPKNSVLIPLLVLRSSSKTWQPLHSAESQGVSRIPFLSENLSFGVVKFQAISLFTPVVTIILMIVLLYVVNHTKLGMAMRAVSKDYEMAKVMGIDIDRIISTPLESDLPLLRSCDHVGDQVSTGSPMMGVMPGLKCFIAAVIGGIGNIKGAVIAASSSGSVRLCS